MINKMHICVFNVVQIRNNCLVYLIIKININQVKINLTTRLRNVKFHKTEFQNELTKLQYKRHLAIVTSTRQIVSHWMATRCP